MQRRSPGRRPRKEGWFITVRALLELVLHDDFRELHAPWLRLGPMFRLLCVVHRGIDERDRTIGRPGVGHSVMVAVLLMNVPCMVEGGWAEGSPA